ncbi:MAG: UbiA family prenyltransferase [Methanobacterium sp.]
MIIDTVKGLYKAARIFPYLEQLILVFPFYAILAFNGFITSAYSLVLVLPYMGVMASGFMYNTISDASNDPKEKNPITRGDISKETTSIGMIVSIIISMVLFILFYKSYLAFIVFLVYIFLWFAYSGLKMRLKESILGPLVASFIGGVAAPLIILIEFNYFNYSSNLLLLGIFAISLAHEIKHTVVDSDEDSLNDSKTFAVLFNVRNSSLMEYLLLIVGFVLLLQSSYTIGNSYILNIIFTVLFLISIVFTISYGIKNNFKVNEVLYNALPYILTRIFIIVYACLIFKLPALLILFIIWILFMDKFR